MANFIQNALPTIGGIAGGVLGGIGGAIAAPFTGGIINPIDAGIAGAGLGGGAGQAIKNMTEGQDALQGNVLESAGENAVGQLAGEGLGMVAKPILGGIGNLAEKGAQSLFKGQFVKGAMDNGTAGDLFNMGVRDANQLADIHPLVTGEKGALSTGVRNGLEETGQGVNLLHLQNFGNNLIAQNQTMLNEGSIPALSQQIERSLLQSVSPDDVTQAAIRRASGGFGNAPKAVNVIDPGALQNVLPENAFKASQEFDNLAALAKKAGFNNAGEITNGDQAAKYNVYRGIANEIKNATFGGDTPIPLSAENKAQIISNLAPLKDVNPDVYNHFVQQVSSANNLQDLRGLQAPIVRGSQALKATLGAADRSGGTSAQQLVGGGAGVLGLLTNNPLEMATGAAAIAAGHPAAGKIGTTVLGRMGDILTNPTVQKLVRQAPKAATVPAANMLNYTFDNNPQGGGMQPTAATTPATGSPVASPEALQMMLGLVGLQADPYLASTFAPMVTGAVPQLQQASSAQAVLPGLERLFTQAGGGQGGMNGLLARLQSLVPGSAGQQYNAQAAQLQQTLQKLGLPGTVTPSLFAGPEAQNAGFGNIQAAINALGGNPQSLLAGVPAS